MTEQENKTLVCVAQRASDRLVNMYSKRANPDNGLIFPLYRAKVDGDKQKNRLSEQEARLMFAIELETEIKSKGCCFSHYSIETPTENRYSGFARKEKAYVDPVYHDCNTEGGCSGSIDLSIYKPSTKCPSINIEFKYGTSVLHEFEKDLLKLYAEAGNGVWFHMFAGNENTLKTIKDRLVQAKDNILERYPFSKKILVLIVSLDPSKSKSNIFENYFL